MKITNKFNLPEAFRKAVEFNGHRQGDYSVTQLLKPSQEVALSIMLDKVLEDDCIDRFWALLGTAVHKVVENYQPEGCANEYFMQTEIAGRTVTGTADIVDYVNERVVDYKTCSSWKFRLDGKDFSDWRNQLKGYLYLLRTKGLHFNDGQIIAILRDWSQTEANRSSEYPQTPVIKVNFHFEDSEIEEVPAKWEAKIKEIEDMLKKVAKGENIGFCPDEETWTSSDSYAVMKEGRKTAVRVFSTKEEAEEFAKSGVYYIVERKGEHKKCTGYCILAKNGFCRGEV